MPAQIRVKELRNLRTGWLDSGPVDKPILFFLHGYPDTPETWQFQINYFEKTFHVVCPYSRGTNPSVGTPERYRYGSEAAVLDNLQILDTIDPTQKQPIVIVGHDLGVVHAWNLAYHLGSRLKGLVMINGLNLPQMYRRLKKPAQLLKSWYIGVMNIPYLPEFLISNFSSTFKKTAYRVGELPLELQPHDFSAIQPLNQYRAFLLDMLDQIKQPTHKLKCPLLVLWGERDSFLLPPTTDEIEQFSEKFTIRYLNANHWVFRERPSEVNELLDGFFSELQLASK